MKQIINVDSVLPLFVESLFFTPEERKKRFPLSGNMGAAYKNGVIYLIKYHFIEKENIEKKKRYIQPLNAKGFYLEILDSFRVSEMKQKNALFRRSFGNPA